MVQLHSPTAHFIPKYLSEISFKFSIDEFYHTHIICATCFDKFNSLHELTQQRNDLLKYFVDHLQSQGVLNETQNNTIENGFLNNALELDESILNDTKF